MSLRWKMIGLLLVAAIATVPVLAYVQRDVLTGGFGRVEAQLADAQAARVSDALGQETEVLRLVTRLQSVWDDPYEHATAKDAAALVADYPPADMRAPWSAPRRAGHAPRGTPPRHR